MIGYWNDEEDAALQGLSLEAQIIYLRGIRRFADKNGVAGVERRINRSSLSEVCHFLPDRRSPRPESKPTWDSVKHRLAELERAGLIVRMENLVFQLPYASQDNSVQMKTAGRRPAMTAPKTARETTPNEPLGHNGFNAVDDTQDGPQDDTPQTVVDGTTSPVTVNQKHNPPNPPESGGKADDLADQPKAPAKAVDQGESDLDTLLSTVWTKPEHSREMFAMPVNWTCTDDELEKYLKLMHVKALVNGKRVTANQLTQDVLADFVRTMHAAGRRQRHEQWVSKLAGWLVTVLANRFKAHGSGLRPEDDPDFDYPLHRSADVPRTQNVIPVEQARSNIARIRSLLNSGVAA